MAFRIEQLHQKEYLKDIVQWFIIFLISANLKKKKKEAMQVNARLPGLVRFSLTIPAGIKYEG